MTRKDITGIISNHAKCSYAAAEDSYKAFITILASELVSAKQAVIPGLGTLVVADQAARPERPGRNPKTGEALTIPAQPAKRKVKFRAIKALKGLVQ